MTLREIDALVHAHVMGYGDAGVFYYTTDPRASKMARDKMRADGWLYRITSHGWTPDATTCSASFWTPTSSSLGKASFGDTEMLAVALAALKAKGVEVA